MDEILHYAREACERKQDTEETIMDVENPGTDLMSILEESVFCFLVPLQPYLTGQRGWLFQAL